MDLLLELTAEATRTFVSETRVEGPGNTCSVNTRGRVVMNVTPSHYAKATIAV